MNIEEVINENNLLKIEVQKLKDELNETKEHLKKYTAPAYKKIYYKTNKEQIKEQHKKYKPSDEQKKKWARTAYLKKKEKEKIENI